MLFNSLTICMLNLYLSLFIIKSNNIIDVEEPESSLPPQINLKKKMLNPTFAEQDDDEDESSFRPALTNLNDVITPMNQIELSSFLVDDEHLTEENDDTVSSSPTATQNVVSVTPSNINLELLVDNVDVVKPAIDVNVVSDLFSYVKEQLKGYCS